jgi:hypothetical protein
MGGGLVINGRRRKGKGEIGKPLPSNPLMGFRFGGPLVEPTFNIDLYFKRI